MASEKFLPKRHLKVISPPFFQAVLIMNNSEDDGWEAPESEDDGDVGDDSNEGVRSYLFVMVQFD